MSLRWPVLAGSSRSDRRLSDSAIDDPGLAIQVVCLFPCDSCPFANLHQGSIESRFARSLLRNQDWEQTQEISTVPGHLSTLLLNTSLCKQGPR
jgi:hypothetical protein